MAPSGDLAETIMVCCTPSLIRFSLKDILPVGMVKQPADHSSEFQMSNEDFPALPGAPAAEPGSSNSILESVKLPTTGLTPEQVFIYVVVGGIYKWVNLNNHQKTIQNLFNGPI